MQIEMYETELRKVADPADVDELLRGIATKRRLEEKASKIKRRLVELDAIIASPKAVPLSSPWQTALEGGDQYGGDQRKEIMEEYQFQSDNLAFTEAAIKDSRSPLDSLLNRVSLPFVERERPLIAKDLQIAVDSFAQGKAALARAVARRDKLDDKGVRTGSIPSYVAPRLVERIEFYFVEIKANFPEVKVP
jgi:elongation factor P--beta-lysine ligase